MSPDTDVEAGVVYAGGGTPQQRAAGLCSRSYVSGLSLADCVLSGRRPAATRPPVSRSADRLSRQADPAVQP